MATGAATPGADDQLSTFSRLLALSGQALEALEAGDIDEVERVLAERSALIADSAGRSTTDAAPPPGAAREILLTANRLVDADRRLTLALTSRRDEIASDLGEMGSGEAARSAYGSTGLRRGRINLVR